MDKLETKKLILLNIDTYPGRFMPNATPSQIETTINMWAELFKDHPVEIVMPAYLEAVKRCNFPVTPANIFEELNRFEELKTPMFDDLWDKLQRAAKACAESKHNILCKDQPYSYDPPETFEEHYTRQCITIWETLPKICREFSRGWRELASMGEDIEYGENKYWFYRFRDYVPDWKERDKTSTTLARLTGATQELIEGAKDGTN